ncbi:MAG: phosphatidylglycerol:prolipoprotein diacylglycerol transferase, partial [Halieaceae bacterium]
RSARPGSPLRRQQVDDLIFYSALGVVLGGRTGYVLFYGGERLAQDPMWLLRVWEGGMSFHGGLLGVICASFLYARQQRIRFAAVLDFVAPLAPLGLALGRLGNFIGQELWGRPADVPWAMVFPRDPLQLARHPSQLYQFALEGMLLLCLLLWFSRRPRPDWAVSGFFAVGYGLLRFVVEFFREPDGHLGFQAFGWMTRGQILCVPMLLLGLYMLWYAYLRGRPAPTRG